MLLEHLGWDEAAKSVNDAVEATFAEGDETARRGPGGKLYVTYDIARQFPGYGEKAGASSLEFTDRVVHHLGRR
jgi:isocitrate dehydrogenase